MQESIDIKTIEFSRWLLSSAELENKTRYVYIKSSDYFIDDDNNRYSWSEMYNIFLTTKK